MSSVVWFICSIIPLECGKRQEELEKKLKIPTKKARKILEKNNFNYRKVIDEEYY